MAKIQIGKTSVKLSLAQQIENAGLSLGRNAEGEMCLTVKFPGTEAIDLTEGSLGNIAETLSADHAEGDSPDAVFARTARDNAEGGMVAQFSDAPRSRSINFTATDREEVASLLNAHLGEWENYASMLAEAEAEAAKGDKPASENSGDDS